MEELPKLANGIGPMGLARMGAPITEMPAKDQQALGLRLGDMVMVLDGYRVLNDPQYACILWLNDGPEVSMIVLREGKDYVELKGTMARRRYGPREGTKPAPPPSH